ncbi:ArsR/SmtB family transcription factor [Arthrobacter sp. GCM10027362]|uniref:ArsR/SmtB family transcription factor n=1 Tax=Arthrobacter sp. GCM10027362 TaxID=3273379 RepID=UPI0036273D11
MAIDDVFAVIAESTRRQILRSLCESDKAVGELVDELEVSQPTVSKHLKVLREAGLVSMRAQGQKRFYSLVSAPLEDVAAWIAAFGLDRGTAGGHAPEPAAVLVPAGDPPSPAARARTLGQAADRAANRAADFLAHLSKPNLPNLPPLRRRRKS